jgi:hypothetical protein
MNRRSILKHARRRQAIRQEQIQRVTKPIYLVIGGKNYGKTWVQKHVLKHTQTYRIFPPVLRSSKCHRVRLAGKDNTIFVGNQSWQEVERPPLDCMFGELHDADLAFVPSWYEDIDHIAQWFRLQKYPCYIHGIFLRSEPTKTDPIMTAPWLDEYEIMNNKPYRSEEVAKEIIRLITNKEASRPY